jgi:hypothetical protein
MVEYAVLLAHNSGSILSGMGGDVLSWASRVNWTMLAYGAAGLLLFRVAFGAFRPNRRY